uniref:Ribosome-recycling factor, mitochondrial n=1 Tax=Steinernema glaseri TaxID=37863 RepID=A0A1I7YCN7_9BILA
MFRALSRSPQLVRAAVRLHSVQQVTVAPLHLSPCLAKVRKSEKKKKGNVKGALSEAAHAAGENEFVNGALAEMQRMEKVLSEELAKHFSLQVDLRVYEDIPVKLESGEEHKLNHLGRVSLKTPHLVMVNLADNPGAIKAVKLAIQKSSLNVNAQHEGVVLYLPVPRMTRERREEMAATAKTKILNDYKNALNDIYTKFDKKSTKASKSIDDASHTRSVLLTTKRAMEARGVDLIEAKRKALLSEVA